MLSGVLNSERAILVNVEIMTPPAKPSRPIGFVP